MERGIIVINLFISLKKSINKNINIYLLFSFFF